MPNLWRRYAQQTLKIEQAYRPKFARIIKQFRAQFISDLKRGGAQFARSELSLTMAPVSLPKLLLASYRSGGRVGAVLQAEYLRGKLKPKDIAQINRARKKRGLVITHTKAGNFGRNELWIREVIEALRLNMLNNLSDITETMRRDILIVLERGIAEGKGIDEIVKDLEIYRIESRAKLIARTEVNKAANAGHKAAAASTPYEVDKGWSAARDHRTRHSHVAVNGQYIGEDDKFNVPVYKGDKLIGYEPMDGPGDPNASVGNIANCRCRRLYRPKRDASGALIMRNPNQARIVTMRSPATQIPAHQIAATLKSHITIDVE